MKKIKKIFRKNKLKKKFILLLKMNINIFFSLVIR
jgi:hypothetical protein